MLRIIFQTLWNYKKTTGLFLIAIAIILFTLPVTMSTLKNTVVEIDTNIQKYARGSYDILVREKDARSGVERQLGLVEENYLAVGKGGISIDEWEEIKALHDIEIAAPVAALGYFTGINKTFSLWMPDDSVRINTEFYTTDGIHEYPLEIQSGAMIKRESGMMDVLASGFTANTFQVDDLPGFLFPPTYHLLVGIDPESEGQLTGISFEDLTKPLSLQQLSNWEFSGDAPIVKVMKLKDPNVPITAQIEYDPLELTSDQLTYMRNKLDITEEQIYFESDVDFSVEEMLESLQEYSTGNQATYTYNFSTYLEPFEFDKIQVAKNGDIYTGADIGALVNMSETSKFYATSRIPYHINDDLETLSVSVRDDSEGIPLYREISQEGGNFTELREDVPFVLQPMGEYFVTEKANELASSPLGIYQIENPKRIKDEDGNSTEPSEVMPTINPGSFVAAPAHGVVSLEGAEIIKGDAPIDAIRVKVSGIEQYDEKAADKIKDVAAEIGGMGFQVDVVAGASPQNMEVDVEGIGTVKELWTTLGAAALIKDNWNTTTFSLALVFGVVAFLYLFNRLRFWKINKRNEISLLYQIGWDKKHIRKRLNGEISLVIAFGWIISLIGILLAGPVLGVTWITYTVNIGLLVILLGIALWYVFRTSDPNGKTHNKTQTEAKKTGNSQLTIMGLLQKNLRFYARYIYSSSFQLLLVAGLANFVYLSVTETQNKTKATSLGEFVNIQTDYMQGIIIVAAYVIGVSTIIDTMNSLLALRSREVGLYRAIGWEAKDIIRVLFSESAFWTGISVFLGSIVSIIIFTLLFSISVWSAVITIISFVGFYGLILFTSYIIITRFIYKNVSDTLAVKRKSR